MIKLLDFRGSISRSCVSHTINLTMDFSDAFCYDGYKLYFILFHDSNPDVGQPVYYFSPTSQLFFYIERYIHDRNQVFMDNILNYINLELKENDNNEPVNDFHTSATMEFLRMYLRRRRSKSSHMIVLIALLGLNYWGIRK